MSAPKKLFIKTYGCQMNVYDSERMSEAMGGAVVAERGMMGAVSFNPVTTEPSFIARGGGVMYAVVAGSKPSGWVWPVRHLEFSGWVNWAVRPPRLARLLEWRSSPGARISPRRNALRPVPRW